METGKENDIPVYRMYKGLQRPLTFKVFKGKYIYWAGGVLLGSMIGGGVVAGTVNNMAGLATFLGVGIGGMLYCVTTQKKKGLYNKTNKTGLFVVTPIHHISKSNKTENIK